ncbi:MAG: EF-Tu/IF-2/RF-3 family GTPase [Chloroflexota bacterium]|jgi:putative protease|nr:EF-Tu/IF-2/RF-3 family GTPase [Chloroflexota bacterium]
MTEIAVGRVTHWFGKLGVAGIELTGTLSVGDTIHIKGHTTDTTLVVESMQNEHQAVETASAGDDVGIKLIERARVGDPVYRLDP